MALRAFHSNPSIGGFGGENAPCLLDESSKDRSEYVQQNGDAFCQIIKELLDNSVDACSKQSGTPRVRVEIQPYKQVDDSILQVTVSDNGCGMEDIQTCVDAFQTSKQYSRTVGRYGVGLTLCLVHAQRLVPGSYSCITSARKESESFARVLYVVDTEKDAVKCYKHETVCKTVPSESGTCVSLLVPGGEAARAAWTRISNYFSRFQLSPLLRCRIEIIAPSLSKDPIFVKPFSLNRLSEDQKQPIVEKEWFDGLEDLEHKLSLSSTGSSDTPIPLQKNLRRRHFMKHALQSLSGSSIKIENVACSSDQLIVSSESQADNHPPAKLSVSFAFCTGSDQFNGREGEDLEGSNPSRSSSSLRLIRMVNQIPLLDGAEASACGVVKSLSSKAMWSQFGLSVSLSDLMGDNDFGWTPLYDVVDTDQVLPFIEARTHGLWTGKFSGCSSSAAETVGSFGKCINTAVLPAKIRLGSMYVIVHIEGRPSSLPLPTLCKGRFPMNHRAIDKAVHQGVKECLKSLQTTSPGLLLTAQQLRNAERDNRYIPAAAIAISSVIHNIENPERFESVSKGMQLWKQIRGKDPTLPSDHLVQSKSRISINLIEAKLKRSIQVADLNRHEKRKTIRQKRRMEQTPKEKNSEENGLDNSEPKTYCQAVDAWQEGLYGTGSPMESASIDFTSRNSDDDDLECIGSTMQKERSSENGIKYKACADESSASSNHDEADCQVDSDGEWW